MDVSKKRLSQITGIAERTLTRYQAEGMPYESAAKRGQPNVYNISQILAWLLDREKSKTTERELDLNTERARLARAQAEKVEVENRVRAGELVKTAVVVKSVAEFCRIVKEMIYTAQDRLSRYLDVKTAARVRKEFDKGIVAIADSAGKAAREMEEQEK
ncbi:phage DNA packaging protein Nu1 [bacterium BMS3Abin14]|nr:phage DNA packaging protein Nu1 [bacterium BMS3Abin14]